MTYERAPGTPAAHPELLAHHHTEDCWGEIDGRLICLRPALVDVDREHLELHVDHRVPSWEDHRRRAIAPRRFDLLGCTAACAYLAVVFALILAATCLVLAAAILLGHLLAAPSSGDQTTVPVDVSGISSAGRQSGAPHWATAPVPDVPPAGSFSGGAPLPRPLVVVIPAAASMHGGSASGNPPRAAGTRTLSGYAGWASPALGRSYLAMRLPRGTLVTITGPGGAWTTRTTDYGPSSRIRPRRVADIAVGRWERVCGLPRTRGLCLVTVELGRAGAIPLAPATDVAP